MNTVKEILKSTMFPLGIIFILLGAVSATNDEVITAFLCIIAGIQLVKTSISANKKIVS